MPRESLASRGRGTLSHPLLTVRTGPLNPQQQQQQRCVLLALIVGAKGEEDPHEVRILAAAQQLLERRRVAQAQQGERSVPQPPHPRVAPAHGGNRPDASRWPQQRCGVERRQLPAFSRLREAPCPPPDAPRAAAFPYRACPALPPLAGPRSSQHRPSVTRAASRRH